MPSLSAVWRQRAKDIRTGVSGGIGNEPGWIEAATWDKAADEIEQYYRRRLRPRPRYKRREEYASKQTRGNGQTHSEGQA